MPHQPGNHAVVLGASMAGLLATRVLADAYRNVTVIDRDAMPEIGAHRRGVPQGRHHHALQPRGAVILEELFPGFTKDVVQAGASSGDVLGHCRWILLGHRLRQAKGGVLGLIVSRPFLESSVRTRVAALPGVTFLERADIVGLTTTPERRVTRYFRAIAKTINSPWELAVSADLALPGVSGSRTRRIRIANAYLPRLLAAASSDVALATAFIRVLGLLDRAEGLLRPDRVLRMWWITRGTANAAIGSNGINHNRDTAIQPEVSPWH
jgi:hypothetical protein